jgi:zinc transporter ZupT
LAVGLQGLFVYSFPYVVIKGKKFLPALFLGMRFFFRTFLKTFLVILVPMILYIPMSMLRGSIGILADMSSPEVVVLILFIGILVGTVIVDALVTIVTTAIFIEGTDEA